MKTYTTAHVEPDSLVSRAVLWARDLARDLVEDEDLRQMAHLALLEAKHHSVGSIAAVGSVKDRFDTAVRREIRQAAGRRRSEVSLEGLVFPAGDPNVAGASGAAAPPGFNADRLHRLDRPSPSEDAGPVEQERFRPGLVEDALALMPDEVAYAVKARFGLDGGDPIEPIDIADVLDEDPATIEGFLDDAERFIRHCAGAGPQRRLSPVTETQMIAYMPTGDFAWYDLRQLRLNNADLAGCDLTNAIMSGMNLWGIDICSTSASGINLWGSQLDGADIRKADLRFGVLERVTLCGADISDADLSDANLWAANLTSLNGHAATLARTNLENAQLCGADLGQADLRGANLTGADLRQAKLMGADLSGANLSDCQLQGADLRWANLDDTDLRNTNLTLADIRGASVRRTRHFDRSERTRPDLPAPLPARLRPLPRSA